MDIQAAILWEQGAPLSVESAELSDPGPGEVLVEVKAAGVCHSDLHPARGDWKMRTPLVLGHEGAGIVRAVGPSVEGVKPNDHVVLCWAPPCGACPPCREGRAVLCDRLERTNYRNKLPSGAARLRARGQDLAPFLGTACFASHTVVAAEGVVVVPEDAPLDALATVGCAVVTGMGAVTAAGGGVTGGRVAVIGAGGVGLNVVQGAALAGAAQIIAVDIKAAPLELARSFGATDAIEASSGIADAIRARTEGRGADVVFDTVGAPSTVLEAIAAARKGGSIVITGLSRHDSQASLPLFPFVMQDKKLIGSVYGSGQPTKDIARLAAWFLEGRLKLRELVARTYRLEQINEALAALASGDGARGVIRW